ncbi:hypothetical protein FKR81_11235 [Lentzea tibetensis]|uniref:Uncharacterized protein n=1 Tax=Lentzea tibetensis TaxID=2591470 RepID=A0A563EWR5_9PSEU|nr:hypothetical protein [Lentzea tibetensis]TWP52146.1 hypothetical protein FKR81_11235 [Lentzea tibetensis]
MTAAELAEAEQQFGVSSPRTTAPSCPTRGCAYRHWLVVSGPERAAVWQDYRADEIDLVPLAGRDGGRVVFGQWCEAWLSESSSGAPEA